MINQFTRATAMAVHNTISVCAAPFLYYLEYNLHTNPNNLSVQCCVSVLPLLWLKCGKRFHI
jgi:hypothetical protein